MEKRYRLIEENGAWYVCPADRVDFAYGYLTALEEYVAWLYHPTVPEPPKPEKPDWLVPITGPRDILFKDWITF